MNSFLALALSFSIYDFLQLDKYKNYDFGRCPRVYCCGQPCLPVGQSDIPRSSTVKVYCPRCEDIYYPRSKYQGSILIITLFSVVSSFNPWKLFFKRVFRIWVYDFIHSSPFHLCFPCKSFVSCHEYPYENDQLL